MRPIDSHCHLEFEEFDSDREEVISEVEKRLTRAVLAGCGFKDNEKAIETAEKSKTLRYCLGLHPLYHQENKVEDIREQISRNDPVAIGEIGLDYNYITGREERENSIEIFKQMLEIAEEENLGAVIHSRNAERKAFELAQEFDVKCFFHCFNGTPELAQEIASEDHYIGVTGQVFHSKRVQNIVESIGVENMLLETDAPYLGLEDRNTPLLVQDVAGEVADIKGLEYEEVVRKTSENSENFYSI